MLTPSPSPITIVVPDMNMVDIRAVVLPLVQYERGQICRKNWIKPYMPIAKPTHMVWHGVVDADCVAKATLIGFGVLCYCGCCRFRFGLVWGP